MTSSFDIHIFGDGAGETMLIEFENEKLGIVDFGYKHFLSWFDKFLKSKSSPTIEFLLWTHPHDDHTRYLSDLLIYLKNNNYTIKNFFRFPFNKFKKLSELLDIGLEQKYEIIVNSPFIYTEKAKPKYLLDLCNQISELKKDGIILNSEGIKFSTELYRKDLLQKELSIHCIAPTEQEIDKYIDLFQSFLEKRFPASELYLDSGKHNIISTAICIKFGENNIILGGDVENQAWSNAMNIERGQEYTCCNLALLKAPHHGSETAYSKENWNNWGQDFHTAVTTYNKSGLPKSQGIQNILNHTKKIYILKDLHNNLLLGEKLRLMSGKLKSQEDITTYSKATNHIKFSISLNGDIEQEWL